MSAAWPAGRGATAAAAVSAVTSSRGRLVMKNWSAWPNVLATAQVPLLVAIMGRGAVLPQPFAQGP